MGWPRFGNTSDNTRFSPLRQITTTTVRQLKVAWSRAEGPNLSLFESDPVVVGRTMYLTTNTDQVIALDAATGAVRWQYTPVLSLFRFPSLDAAIPTSRGVTVAHGIVYLLTFDDQLIALHASSGRVLWRTRVASPARGYSEPSPATYWHGMLFAGSAEGDAGLRGFVGAYDSRTGRQLWRFYTVPAPGHGWVPRRGHHGGGDVWMPPTIDTRAGVLYAGTGNPSPDFTNAPRPGCNRWTDATLALEARTGRLLWGHTEVCPDLWDYDTDQPPVLFNIFRRGETIRAVGQGNKDGRYSILNARTGRLLSRTTVVPQSIPHLPPSRKGVRVCPGEFGGLLYSPAAYDPRLHAMYVPALQICGIYTRAPKHQLERHAPGAPDLGGTVTSVPPFRGVVGAINVSTGKFRWRRAMPAPVIGGALATAGNLVFTGCDNGRFYALDARTGATRWSANLGLPFGAAPITYMIRGVQYVAIAAGGSSVAVAEHLHTGGKLFVFKLGASARG